MPSICFSGFPLGSVVSIDGVMTTSWGQMSEGDSIWDLEPTPGASVEINARRSNLQAAPEAFQFDLTLGGFETNTLGDESAYDPSYHDKSVFWDYGDSYQFTAPEQVQSGNLDSRWSRGPLGSHTYRASGDFVARVAVIEHSSGRVGFGTFRIGGTGADTPPVQAASDVFQGAATMFVDTNGAAGGYPNAPAGAVRYDNIQAAIQQMPSSARATRVILERGQTHVISGGRNLAMYTRPLGPTSFRIEANIGDGAKPILTLNPANFSSGFVVYDGIRFGNQPDAEADIVFAGLDCRGLWDSTTETGAPVTFVLSASDGSSYTLYDDCEFTGWAIAHQSANHSRETMYTINDTAITNWQEYAVYDSSPYVSSAFTGARMTQDINALSGGPRTNPHTHNTQGPIRFGGPKSAHVWATDMFSNTGWFPHGAIYDVQPCLRFASSGQRAGARLNLGACALESGGQPIAFANSDGSNADVPINALLDGNVFLGGWRAAAMTRINSGGTTWRNNFFVKADAQMDGASISGPSTNSNRVFEFNTSGTGSAAGNYTTPTNIYNNTFINLLSPANAAGGTGEMTVLDISNGFVVVEENNILHEPNLAAPKTTYGTTVVAPPDGTLSIVAMFTARYKGYRDFDTVLTLDTTFATPAGSGVILVPQIGSPALGAALGEPNSTTSFSGTRRPEPPSIGAAELE